MFQTAIGVTIPFPERILEEFQIFDSGILLNLSFEKLNPFIAEFIEQLLEPLFFVLELPLSEQEEVKLRKDDTYPFHKKVCYLDNQSKDQIKEIMQRYGTLLLNDGMSQFAIYSHVTREGIYIQKYKVVRIFNTTLAKYVELFEKYNLRQTDNILTVWDTFSHNTPGEVHRVEMNGINVFDVYDNLVKIGLYVAQITEG